MVGAGGLAERLLLGSRHISRGHLGVFQSGTGESGAGVGVEGGTAAAEATGDYAEGGDLQRHLGDVGDAAPGVAVLAHNVGDTRDNAVGVWGGVP